MKSVRRVQVAIAHSPKDPPRRVHLRALHICLERLTHRDELKKKGLSACSVYDSNEQSKEAKNRRRNSQKLTQSISSSPPVPSFHLLALEVTAFHPSPVSTLEDDDSASHSHIAAFRRSRTDSKESLDTTSCEYTSEMMRWEVRCESVASVRELSKSLD